MYVHYMVAILSITHLNAFKTILHGNKVDKPVETTDLIDNCVTPITLTEPQLRSRFAVLLK